jgi:hypothetical protein
MYSRRVTIGYGSHLMLAKDVLVLKKILCERPSQKEQPYGVK